MKKRTEFLAGIGSVLLIAYFSKYIYPQKDNFLKDRRHLHKDTLTFGKGLYSTTKKDMGKSSSAKISANKDSAQFKNMTPKAR